MDLCITITIKIMLICVKCSKRFQFLSLVKFPVEVWFRSFFSTAAFKVFYSPKLTAVFTNPIPHARNQCLQSRSTHRNYSSTYVYFPIQFGRLSWPARDRQNTEGHAEASRTKLCCRRDERCTLAGTRIKKDVGEKEKELES
jgi:hypothetical protein